MKLAALVLASVAALPAAAKDRLAPRVDYSVTARATTLPEHSTRRDARYFTSELAAGPYAAPPPMMGMPIVENIDLGVGLYSVHGARIAERDFRRRLEPVSEIRSGGKSASSRVAAVGMSVRF